MEDYTFMFLKQPQDFIVRIISDFLPHTQEIDFFEEVKSEYANKTRSIS
jgi:hypothetical protein